MNLLVGDTLADCFRNDPDTLVIHNLKSLLQLLRIQRREVVAEKTVHMLLQRTDRLHQRALEVVTDAHDLSGRLHLGRQRPLCRDKFIKGQSRNLDNTVVKRRFKGCVGLLCDGILDLIQRVAQRNLCGNLCDRIACRLGCQRRGTAHTGIYLDDTVFKAGGMQCKLHITATCDL